MCDRVIIINGGKLVADNTAAALSEQFSRDNRMLLRVVGPAKDVQAMLSRVPGVRHVNALGEKEPGAYDFAVIPEAGCDVRRDIFQRVAERGWVLLGMRSMQKTLEEIFITLTGGDHADAKEAK